MKRRKITALVMLLALAAGILSGCHGTLDTGIIVTEAPTAEPAATAAVTEEPAEPTATAEVTEEPAEPTAAAEATEEPAEPTAAAEATEEPAEPTATAEATEEPAEPTAAAEVTETPEPTPAATDTPAPARTSGVVPAAMDESRKIELTFWAKNDTNKVQTAVYTKAIEDFERMYPHIKINLRLYADYGRIFNDVITNIGTNTTPNICITYPDHIATYLTGDNVMLQLDEWMADPLYGLGGSEVRFDSPKQEEIVPQFLAECVLNGHYYALPYMRSTEALYINKELVEKLGYEVPDVLTWDFVWEVSEKAMEKDANGLFTVNGQKVMIPFIYKSTDNMMITMLRQLDAPYSTDRGEVLLFNDTTAGLLKEIYTHAQSRAFSTFAISSYPGNFLNQGQCIFALDSTAGATWMGSDAPMLDIHREQVVPFTTLVRPIPQYDPENPLMISQGPSICVFNKKDPQVVLASWLFAQYLLSNEVQLGYAETEGYLPVTLKAQQSAEYQEYLSRKGENNEEFYSVKIEASELLMRYTGNTFVTPVFDGSASLRSAAGQLIENVCKGARRKEAMSDAYIAKQFKEVQSLYRLDRIKVLPATPVPTSAPATPAPTSVPAEDTPEPETAAPEEETLKEEPTAEPAAEAVTEEPTAEAVMEEPTAEPAAEAATEEPTAEPTAEPETGAATEEPAVEKTGFGALPGVSQALLILLPAAWILIITFSIMKAKKQNKRLKKDRL